MTDLEKQAREEAANFAFIQRDDDKGDLWNAACDHIANAFRHKANPFGNLLAFRDPQPGDVEALRHKLWMIACHATGGGIPTIDGIDRSTNDICVQITASRNAVYEAGKESALAKPRPDREEGDNAETAQAGLKGVAQSEGAQEAAIHSTDTAEEARPTTPEGIAALLEGHAEGIVKAWDQRYAPEGIGGGIIRPVEVDAMLHAASFLRSIASRPDREAVEKAAESIWSKRWFFVSADAAPDAEPIETDEPRRFAEIALFLSEPVQEMREGERVAMQEAFHAIDAALGTSDDVIEWIEPIRASKRGQADDDELRRERKTALYGMLDGARERLRAALLASEDAQTTAGGSICITHDGKMICLPAADWIALAGPSEDGWRETMERDFTVLQKDYNRAAIIIDRLRAALEPARPIVEADHQQAKEMADADWEGMSYTALEAIRSALSEPQEPGEGAPPLRLADGPAGPEFIPAPDYQRLGFADRSEAEGRN